jgi:polysaccharide deacetylase 2 family uncharacterized protein YibQ
LLQVALNTIKQTNKQELPLAAIFIDGMGRNEETL